MAGAIVSTEYNPQYPKQDISPETADILSLMLQNYDLANDAHIQAESRVPFYARAHQAVGFLAHRLSREEFTRGMDIGTSTFEAISVMVRPTPPRLEAESIGIYQTYLVKGGIIPTIDVLEQAGQSLEEECPHTAYVVREVAARYHKSFATSALMAAGISRKIELDILDAA